MKDKLFYLIFFVLVLGISRIIPHPPNFTPILALAIFGGAFLTNKRTALCIPVIAMFLSDLIIGFHSQIYAVYLCIIVLSLLGNMIEKRNILNLGIVGISGSLLFFIVTNFSVWLTDGLYPLNLTGLMQCYIMAIPFFHNTLISTVISLAILFTGYSLIEKRFLKILN